MATDDAVARQAERKGVAEEILSRLQLMELWAAVGEPKLVGAAAYGLLVAPDIDIEIYCDEPRVEAGFSIVANAAQSHAVRRVRFSNELDGPDRGLFWQLRYRTDDGEMWTVDMWLLGPDHPGPRSADLVDPMRRALSDETRHAILEIKEALRGEPDVRSIDIYTAVLDEGVRSAPEFRLWHSRRTSSGLSFWRPR